MRDVIRACKSDLSTHLTGKCADNNGCNPTWPTSGRNGPLVGYEYVD